MKKYLFGLIAVTFAVAFSAFTVASKKTTVIFEYSDNSDANLTLATSWTATPVLTCEAESEEQTVCQLEIVESEFPGYSFSTTSDLVYFLTQEGFTSLSALQTRETGEGGLNVTEKDIE